MKKFIINAIDEFELMARSRKEAKAMFFFIYGSLLLSIVAFVISIWKLFN